MAISKDKIIEEMMRARGKELNDAYTDAMIYGTGIMKQTEDAPSYSMAEIALQDGTSQTFMMKASTRITDHLLSQMKEKGYLVMWNDTDVLCIRADQVKQFTLRAFTQEK